MTVQPLGAQPRYSRADGILSSDIVGDADWRSHHTAEELVDMEDAEREHRLGPCETIVIDDEPADLTLGYGASRITAVDTAAPARSLPYERRMGRKRAMP